MTFYKLDPQVDIYKKITRNEIEHVITKLFPGKILPAIFLPHCMCYNITRETFYLLPMQVIIPVM